MLLQTLSGKRLGQRFKPVNTVSPFVAVAENKDIVSNLETFHEAQEIENEMELLCEVTSASVKEQLLNMYGGDRESLKTILRQRRATGLSQIAENQER